MEKTYAINIKGYPIAIEITWFRPAIKCNNEHPEFQFEDEDMEFEWKARTGNDLLNMIIEEDLFEYVDTELRKQLK